MPTQASNIRISFLLAIIIVIGAFLRFYGLDVSLSNDELSAWYRLQFEGFGQLILNGVKPDGHPAGVQVFLYAWVKVFGDSAISLRLPFALAGIGSIHLVFLIGKKWFHPKTGLFAATALSFLQYFIYHSQLARPYSLGLFFVLASVYFFTLILQSESKPGWKWLAGYSIFTALSLYTHYFSGLQAIIIGISGLFVMPKTHRGGYVVAGIAAILLFLPHLGITLHQIKGAGLDWLSKPEENFILNFFFRAFNSSNLVLFGFLGICSYSLWKSRHFIYWNKYHSLALFWFIIPFAILYCYSVLVKPVLQFNALYFSFPFILLAGFSFLGAWSGEITRIRSRHTLFLFLLSVFMLWTLIGKNKYYTSGQHSDFKNISAYAADWMGKNQIEKDELTAIAQVNNPAYLNYYLDRYGKPLDFSISNCCENGGLDKLEQVIAGSKSNYCIYLYSFGYTDPMIDPAILKKYPLVVDEFHTYHAGVVIYQKEKYTGELSNIVYNDFEEGTDSSSLSGQAYTTEQFFGGASSLKTGTEQRFGKLHTSTIKNPIAYQGKAFDVRVFCLAQGILTHSKLAISIEREGENVFWKDILIKRYAPGTGIWFPAYLSGFFPSDIQSGDLLKLLIWNLDQYQVYADDLEFRVQK